MRKPLFDDDILEDHEWEDILKKLDKFFTGKDGKSEMDRICLQFDLHRIIGSNEELKPMCEPFISNPIINSKSRYKKSDFFIRFGPPAKSNYNYFPVILSWFIFRNLGILELYPETISAQKACCKYGRTIYLPSKFKLPT